jgi:carboxyl-terminal processing protease
LTDLNKQNVVLLLRGALIGSFAVLLLMLGFLTGYLFHGKQFPGQAFPILNEAYDILLRNGLKDPPANPGLEYGMIRGMLQAYDEPHTIFVDPPQHELETDQLEGKYGGIGVQLVKDSQGVFVLIPFPDSPAQKAGLLEGDHLLKVDELGVTPQTPSDQIEAALRGPVGEVVHLEIAHPPDYASVKVAIRREEVPLPSVTWRQDLEVPVVGILDVNLIAASTPDEIERAVADLKGRGVTDYILDLRDNPGGLLDAGVDIARLFLTEGIVVQEQYRGKDVETSRVEKPGPLSDIPLVVLINGGSASAAEITAGALQVHQRALLIGEHSYGKDTIQLVFELRDKSSLHVTAAHWWIPGLATPIADHGLQPDILVDPPTDAAGKDLILQTAVETLMKK